MLGGYDPEAFDGLTLKPFGLFLSCIFMLIVSILLLNLLIALMGDSYSSVAEKGLGQWKLEQAQIITEMAGTMKERQRNCTEIVHFRKNTDEIDDDDDAEEDGQGVGGQHHGSAGTKGGRGGAADATVEEMRSEMATMAKRLDDITKLLQAQSEQMEKYVTYTQTLMSTTIYIFHVPQINCAPPPFPKKVF